MSFKKWLVEEMAKREWTNSDVANKAGLSRSVIGYYLEGRTPNNEAIAKLARAFGVTIETVMRHVGTIPPVSIRDELSAEADYLFNQLKDEGDKRKILNIIKTFIGDEDEGKVNHRMSSNRNHNHVALK